MFLFHIFLLCTSFTSLLMCEIYWPGMRLISYKPTGYSYLMKLEVKQKKLATNYGLAMTDLYVFFLFDL